MQKKEGADKSGGALAKASKIRMNSGTGSTTREGEAGEGSWGVLDRGKGHEIKLGRGFSAARQLEFRKKKGGLNMDRGRGVRKKGSRRGRKKGITSVVGQMLFSKDGVRRDVQGAWWLKLREETQGTGENVWGCAGRGLGGMRTEGYRGKRGYWEQVFRGESNGGGWGRGGLIRRGLFMLQETATNAAKRKRIRCQLCGRERAPFWE